MKTSGFDSGVKGALGKLASIGSAAAKITAGIGLAGGIAAGALIAKSIGKASEIEDLTTGFIPLLGSVKAAQDRIAELAEFAAKTNFDIPGVVRASTILQTLTKGALATGNGLRLVGDVASGTSGNIEEIAVTVGRLYDGLDSGRPVGEALARLQELGAISGTARGKLEALQAEGKKGPEVWKIAADALSKFDRMMELKSRTWSGMMLNLDDEISQVMAHFGKPIMDSLKPFLAEVIAKVSSLKESAAGVGQVIGESVGVIRSAFDGGKVFALAGASLRIGFVEAINTLAAGVRAAVLAGVSALQSSGLLLTFTSFFQGIGQQLASVLQSAAADFAESIGRSGMAKGFRELSQASDLRAGNYFQIASVGAEIFDPNKTAADFVKAFQAAFKSAPELINSSAARKQFEAIFRPLQGSAAADSVFREVFAEADANAVVKPKGAAGSPGDAIDAGTARKGGSPTTDRLAQIGGYVGSSAAALAQKAAEKTARWTEQSAKYLRTLASRGGERRALEF
jgi:hypothetical protein